MNALEPVPGSAPLPNESGGVAGFAASLRALKIHVGNPSLKELAKRSGIPRSTLADALNPERSGVPRLTVVTAFVEACGVTRQEALGWRRAWRAVQNSQDLRRTNRLDRAADPGRRLRGSRNAPDREVAGSSGRPSELTLVMADVDGGMVVCTFDGAAGTADTRLAVHAARSLTSSSPNVTSFVGPHGRLRGRELRAAREALRTLLCALGVPEDSVPEPLERRSAT